MNKSLVKSRILIAMQSYATHYDVTPEKWLKLTKEARDANKILNRDITRLVKR